VNKLKFKDSIVLESLVDESAKSDVAEILRRDKNPRLRVDIDATHSGVVINQRVYPGKHVKNGYKTFFSKDRGGAGEYDKPILKHHDLQEDPIGRIIDARYTQLKTGDIFEYDYLQPEPNGSKGSGVVSVTGIISDPDSIKKITDSRFLSVSAGHSSPMLLCSTCGDSVMECSHMPGKKYGADGEPDEDSGTICYAITGPMTYHELSFVNLPASPSAKLVNFNWTDGKDSWDKHSIIASQITGKKESVRTFSLCDDDGELSLLNSRYNSANKKTVIAVSPAVADKLKHVMSSEEPTKADVTSNVRLTGSGPVSGVSNVEQNLDKANDLDNTSKQGEKMTDNKIESLETEVKSLTDQLATAKTEVDTLKKQVEAKDSQIQRLTTDSAAVQSKMGKALALSLASVRTKLKKSGTEGVDSKEKFDAYVEKLSTRSIDSLQDSLQDLMVELDQLVVDSKPETKAAPAKEVVATDKVSDPTLSKGTKPETKVAKKSGATRATDALSKALGLE
jgi:archaellum component FlaC